MLKLREANDSDIKFYFELRNTPEVYQGFYTQKEPLQWEEHRKWWYSRNQDWRKFIIELDDAPIGILNIGQLDHWSPEIGYAIHPDYWNRGYGCKAVELATEVIKSYGKAYCHTTVKTDNKSSLRLLEKLGFEVLGKAREGEVWLTLKLG